MNLRINSLLNAMSLSLVAIMLVLASSLYYIYRQVGEFQGNWNVYSQQSSDQHIFFNTLTRDLGYRGMINGFKNYILREDSVLLANARPVEQNCLLPAPGSDLQWSVCWLTLRSTENRHLQQDNRQIQGRA